MPFNIQSSLQMSDIDNSIKTYCYQQLFEISKKHCSIRLAGAFIGTFSALLTMTKAIGLVAEPIFKGVLNIIGSPFFKDCRFCWGIQILIVDTSINILLIPFSLFAAILGIAIKTVKFAYDPIGYSQKKWFQHDIESQELFEKSQELLQAVEKNPKDIKSLVLLGTNLIKLKEISAGLVYLERAADEGDLDTKSLLGKCYLWGIDNDKKYCNFEKAFKYNQILAHENDPSAQYRLGIQHLQGLGTCQNIEQGIHWLSEAAKSADANYKCLYVETICKFFSTHPPTKNDFMKAVGIFKEAIRHGHRESHLGLAAILNQFPHFEYPGENALSIAIKGGYKPEDLEKFKKAYFSSVIS